MLRKMILLLVVGLLPLGYFLLLRPVLEIATGYTAKQYCSGLQISAMPQEFIWQYDIAPRMAALGPLRRWLKAGVEIAPNSVSSRLLGVQSKAVYRPALGCTLNIAEAEHTAAGLELAPHSPAPAPALLVEPASSALEQVLAQAFAEPAEGGRNTLAVLVAQRGQLLAERYRAPVTAATPLQGWSMNKSLLATWVGMQHDRGHLSLETPVAPVLAQQGGEHLASNLAAELNLGHLLHMESGLDFQESYRPGDDATQMLYRSRAAWAVAPAKGQAAAPGELFNYSSGDSNVAALLWQQSLGERPYQDWLREEFQQVLGLAVLVAEPDASAVEVASSYTYMLARDWLRVGQLWLDAWHGRSDLLSQDWQRSAVQPRRASSDGSYGRSFWLNTQGVTFPNLPATVFYASGNAGQALVVMPEQEIVVLRLGLSASAADTGLSQLLEGVVEALGNSAASPAPR
ncbi:serine hydrolase [Parahaliea sp. F7430]|uniref:Serine hydrolase n=1 Tax=Sediminihaliea albiluteola TaxID=2758564 RepID=A0A7W2YJT1_9GAMM|nr:serine hydrolase [Sediminihaliea albiluteola]MBA6413480.1 serine hydrolase [Sediminihaliea albiluteola]